MLGSTLTKPVHRYEEHAVEKLMYRRFVDHNKILQHCTNSSKKRLLAHLMQDLFAPTADELALITDIFDDREDTNASEFFESMSERNTLVAKVLK
jgi:hypothetical protein